MTTPNSAITAEIMRKMLAADNGISTSGFQLYENDQKTVAITLNNFCKLQSLEDDDRDEILSCLEFRIVDLYAATSRLATALA